MGMAYPIVTDHRAIRTWDVILSVWVVMWSAIALVIAFEIHDLTRISDTLVDSSEVLEETGVVLTSLRDVPVVGDRVEDVEREIIEAARSARISGDASRNNITRLSVLLGLAIAFLPTVPVVGLYVPLRVSWNRDVRAVLKALRESGDDPTFREILARRAAERLPFHQLVDVSSDPWRDLERGHYDALSRAELRRLGIVHEESPD
jgi:hypothetical protein